MSGVKYQLEESYESPDRWLRCVEGDAKSLIGPGPDGYDTAADAMREHWWQEHAGKLADGLKPWTALRFGTAEVLPDGPRTPYVEHVRPTSGRA